MTMSFFFLYIDPGTGSMIVQMLIAAFLGIAYFFRSIVNFIKSLLGMKVTSPEDEGDT